MTGLSPDESLVEIIELADHPWFLAVQFHPEFKSKPTKAHPCSANLSRRPWRVARRAEVIRNPAEPGDRDGDGDSRSGT